MIIMGKFKFTETGIEDMFVVEPTVFEPIKILKRCS